jgi:hypothetical protein
LVTSVDFGWYSSIVGVRCPCEVCCFCRAWLKDAASRVAATWGHTNKKITTAQMTESNARVHQDFIVSLWYGIVQLIFPQDGATMLA